MAKYTYLPTYLSCICLVSDMSKFHSEIEKLKEILLFNGYSTKLIDKCISKFMNRLYTKKTQGKYQL